MRVPAAMAEIARDILASGAEAAKPRDAATVMLLREPPSPGPPSPGPASPGPPSPGPPSPARPGQAPTGFEIYMLRRKPTMAFAPGAYVFPGGSVDPRDADPGVGWSGPPAEHWSRVLDAPPDLARALVCAAVRETFEESGVLLAGPEQGQSPSQQSLVADTTGDDWEADRRALLDRTLSLAELLARRNLVVRSDLLKPWARWITPATEPRRFDARFFAAVLPPGQRTRDVGGEAAAVRWITPAAALDAAREREIELWFPTAITLAELADCADHAAVFAADRDLRPRLPELSIEDDTEVWLTVPGDREYPL
jgi:8-oxo-dGTP pyrophosphatase MutT (NUDIX family)